MNSSNEESADGRPCPGSFKKVEEEYYLGYPAYLPRQS